MINCSICGLPEPHHHDATTVSIERQVRPAFEKVMVDLFNPLAGQMYRLWQIGGSWMTQSPTHDGCCYPVVFGWHGAPSSNPYGPDHWAYRAALGEPYLNQGLEFAWQLWQRGMMERRTCEERT